MLFSNLPQPFKRLTINWYMIHNGSSLSVQFVAITHCRPPDSYDWLVLFLFIFACLFLFRNYSVCLSPNFLVTNRQNTILRYMVIITWILWLCKNEKVRLPGWDRCIWIVHPEILQMNFYPTLFTLIMRVLNSSS